MVPPRGEFRAYAQIFDYAGRLGISFIVNHEKGRLLGKLVFEEIGDDYVSEPTLEMDFNAGKVAFTELVNRLWDLGIRPYQAQGSAGQLDATKYHLEDMRKLALKGRV